MPTSVFADQYFNAYDHFNAEVRFIDIAGATPTDQRAIEGWIRKNMRDEKAEDEIARHIMEAMEERGVTLPEAESLVIAQSKLIGFRRHGPETCPQCKRGIDCADAGWKGLFFEGRCVKSAIKEYANHTWPKRTWGPTRKGTMSFWAEHVHVVEDRLPFHREEPDEVEQSFVHVWRGHGFKYEEILYDATLAFTVAVTKEGMNLISDEDWATLWTRGQKLGMGASRSQGRGEFYVTKWERADTPKPKRPKK